MIGQVFGTCGADRSVPHQVRQLPIHDITYGAGRESSGLFGTIGCSNDTADDDRYADRDGVATAVNVARPYYH